jgi:hypothetical protein
MLRCNVSGGNIFDYLQKYDMKDMCVKKEVFFSLSCEEEEEEFYVMYCLYKY